MHKVFDMKAMLQIRFKMQTLCCASPKNNFQKIVVPFDVGGLRDEKGSLLQLMLRASFCLGVPMEPGAAVLNAAAVQDISSTRLP